MVNYGIYDDVHIPDICHVYLKQDPWGVHLQMAIRVN